MMIEAVVTGQGLPLNITQNSPERLYLLIKKTEVHGFPIKDGEQMPITIVIGGIEYSGELSRRANLPSIFLKSKLWGQDGIVHQQTNLLLNNGLSKNQRVQLSVNGNRVALP
jgi:hypothetical protein